MSDNIEKFLASGESTENRLTVQVPIDIQKDSERKRIVVGFATLDNVDLTGDVITKEASQHAFANFRGNVRVQHDKLRPVGTVVDFRPATYFDPITNKEYNGVQVAVQISEGAEDIWKMCLDRTLSGFSVGGKTRKMSTEYREDLQKSVQVIEEYFLEELSLVDSPANHLANVNTIYKSVDGVLQQPTSDIHMHAEFQKVFEIETKGEPEHMAEENTPVVVDEASTASEEAAKTETVETPAVETETVKEEVVAVETPAVEEVKPEAKPDLQEVIADLSRQIAEQSEKVSKSVSESVSDQLDSIEKSFTERFSGVIEDQKSLAEKFGDIQTKLDQLETTTQKSIDEISANTALQKSLDDNAPVEKVETEEDTWKDLFSAKY